MDINVLKEREMGAFLQMGKLSRKEVKNLLQELGAACGEVEYLEDFEWLNKAITKWEIHLKAEFKELYLTLIEKPKKELKRRSGVVGGWIRLA